MLSFGYLYNYIYNNKSLKQNKKELSENLPYSEKNNLIDLVRVSRSFNFAFIQLLSLSIVLFW